MKDINDMPPHTLSELAVLAGHCEFSGAKSSHEHCTNLTIQIIFQSEQIRNFPAFSLNLFSRQDLSLSFHLTLLIPRVHSLLQRSK